MFNKCVYFKLNATVRELNRLWDQEFKTVKLTAPQGYMLRMVLAMPGQCQKEIAQALSLDRSTVTRLLEGLEKKAFVKREAGTDDCRMIKVMPTAKAKKLEPQLGQITQRLIKKLAGLAPAETIENLVSDSEKFLELLKTK